LDFGNVEDGIIWLNRDGVLLNTEALRQISQDRRRFAHEAEEYGTWADLKLAIDVVRNELINLSQRC
jgi:hypothetical protein